MLYIKLKLLQVLKLCTQGNNINKIVQFRFPKLCIYLNLNLIFTHQFGHFENFIF